MTWSIINNYNFFKLSKILLIRYYNRMQKTTKWWSLSKEHILFLDNNKEILQSINKIFLEECIIFFNAIKIFFTYSPEYSNTNLLFMPTQLFFRNDLFNKQELSFFQKILEILACDNSSCSYIANKIKTQSKHEKKLIEFFHALRIKKYPLK